MSSDSDQVESPAIKSIESSPFRSFVSSNSDEKPKQNSSIRKSVKKELEPQSPTKLSRIQQERKSVKSKDDSQQSPSKRSSDIAKQEILQLYQDDEGKPKPVKKMPKLSLKRQMTQKRFSAAPNLTTEKLRRGSQRNVSEEFQSVTNLDQILQKNQRTSLQLIKEDSQKSQRNSMVPSFKSKGPKTSSSNLNTKSVGGITIQEQESESESGQESVQVEEIQQIEEEEEEDIFKKVQLLIFILFYIQYEDDPEFQQVFEIAEKITSQIHSDQDIEDIVNYLKNLAGLKGKFDHLTKNLTKKLIDCLEIKFQTMGEYLFKKGEKADYAYVVLFGQVIFLNVKTTTFLPGQEPPSPVNNLLQLTTPDRSQKEIIEQYVNFERRQSKIKNDQFVIMEEEIKLGESSIGAIIGENAMLDQQKATRALSAMAKTDCIFLLLNKDAFEILVKEKMKKDREQLCQFVFDSIPKMKEQFQFKKVLKMVHYNFTKENFNRNQDIFKEGEKSDKLYIIKEGQCIIYKKIEVKDMLGVPRLKHEKIMNIEAGGLFGEDGLIFDKNNSYTVKAISPVQCLVIKYDDLRNNFKRLLPSLQVFFEKRCQFISDRYQEIKNAKTYEKKFMNSNVEKGNMNVFLQKDFKNQVSFADNKTKRKLQMLFIRKELEQLQDAQTRLTIEMEKEKRDLQSFQHPLNFSKSYAHFSKFSETPQDDYVKKVLSPQRILKNDYGQIQKVKQIAPLQSKSTNNAFTSSISTRNLMMNNKNHLNNFQQVNKEYTTTSHQTIGKMRNFGEKRTQSQASLQNYTKNLNQNAFRSLSIDTHEGENFKGPTGTGGYLMHTPNSFQIQQHKNRFFNKRFTKQSIGSTIK